MVGVQVYMFCYSYFFICFNWFIVLNLLIFFRFYTENVTDLRDAQTIELFYQQAKSLVSKVSFFLNFQLLEYILVVQRFVIF